jgi:hypothetical protein
MKRLTFEILPSRHGRVSHEIAELEPLMGKMFPKLHRMAIPIIDRIRTMLQVTTET